ncbi:ABC transporter ATP-binding protein [Microbacterium sp. STN6]|uniref:ABC transporter ATP-binding protein n=1 Tax=Microbacterium sp. STN6 TaxID=2995588 RepID=UPI002260A7B3|nr:ABC transporter ATP-binding protein [Microbacterium sp. STN6]MCX7522474.1 ABC transporter ATP-binding protein [Microbacterium sp. STN6]
MTRRIAVRLVVVLGAMIPAAVLAAIGAVIAGAAAKNPAPPIIVSLAVALIGSVLLQSVASLVASSACGLIEGVIRARLAAKVVHEPLAVLEQQGAGELIDRVDDDPAQLATLLRGPGLWLAQGSLGALTSWIFAGITWWPAWILFPVVGVATVLIVRRLAPEVARLKVAEETAWSAHGSQFEESVAARKDLIAASGQAYALRRFAELGHDVLTRVKSAARGGARVSAITSIVINSLAALLAVVGVVAVGAGWLNPGQLVTLWLLIAGFVGALGALAAHLPDIQTGIGAYQRIRQLLGAPQDPAGGAPVPDGSLAIELRTLTFRYPGGGGIDGVSLTVPAGTTTALVGRTGSGKSTLGKLISRSVEPEQGMLYIGGVDAVSIDLDELRDAIGVVSQRTELLSATLVENVTLFRNIPRERVGGAFHELGLDAWVRGLPRGLDTVLGPGGVTLSAGEEQLVAFARLLVRDVRVVILDEATARMDPHTATYVDKASTRLLAGRTGIVIAHRAQAVRHSDQIVVLDAGRIVRHGSRTELADALGPEVPLSVEARSERENLAHTGSAHADADPAPGGEAPFDAAPTRHSHGRAEITEDPRPRSGLAGTVTRLMLAHPRWGVSGDLLWLLGTLFSISGVATGLLWGRTVASLQAGGTPWVEATLVALGLLLSPLGLGYAAASHPRWLAGITLRLRAAILRGRLGNHRRGDEPAAEVTVRALDSTRLTAYVDIWIGVFYGVVLAIATGIAGGGFVAFGVAASVMVLSALVSIFAIRPLRVAGERAGDARARFGRTLGTTVDAIASIKLAGAAKDALARVHETDTSRIALSIRENHVRNIFWSVPGLLVQLGVVAAWVLYAAHVWGLASTLLMTTALGTFAWNGFTAGSAVSGYGTARTWLDIATNLADTDKLVARPRDLDVVAGMAHAPAPDERVPLRRLDVSGIDVVHDDGTIAVRGAELSILPGELVVVIGRVGSGKSSLLSAIAGLTDIRGTIAWNGCPVESTRAFLRPHQIAYVSQTPRIVSGSVADNIALDHPDRDEHAAARAAELGPDFAANGIDAPVGFRGNRLSGGQVQRVALARALAIRPELLIADDLSSALDPRTEASIWRRLRDQRRTMLASTSRRSVVELADRVLVMEHGRIVDTGRWCDLTRRWSHLAE